MGVSEQRRQSPELRSSKFSATVEYGEKNNCGARILTPATPVEVRSTEDPARLRALVLALVMCIKEFWGVHRVSSVYNRARYSKT
jgi:hypothetical protein